MADVVILSPSELQALVAAAVSAGVREALATRPDDGRLTLAEASRRAGVSVRVLRAAIASGALPAARPGKTYVVAGSDLDDWLAARRVAPRPAPKAASDPASVAIARARAAGRIGKVKP